jgi:predicted Zn-dependent peptidase
MTIINGDFRHYELDNGLVVALQNTSTQTVSAKLRVNYGASHQKLGEEGMAHFLEHCLVAGGSEKYDPFQADRIRGGFGMLNACTNTGRTFFIGEMLSEDLQDWLDYTADHTLHPRFDADRVNAERQRVLREISDAKSRPDYLREREFTGALYGNHPAGIFVLGSEGVVELANLDALAKFHARGYSPNNMDLIIAGGLPENVEEMVQQYFGDEKRGENTRREFPQLKLLSGTTVLHQSAPEMKNMERPDESSAQLLVVFNTPVGNNEDMHALRTMSQILGGGTNSLLFKKVSLERGLAYSIGSGVSDDYNAGIMSIGASVLSVRKEEAVQAIFEEIERMKSTTMPVEEVEGVRKGVKYRLAKIFETNEGHIGALEAKLDENLNPEEYIGGYDAVTPEKVREVAKRYLPSREGGNYLLTVQDPLKE